MVKAVFNNYLERYVFCIDNKNLYVNDVRRKLAHFDVNIGFRISQN